MKSLVIWTWIGVPLVALVVAGAYLPAPVGDIILSFVCWIMGFICATKTDWAVTHALAIQEAFPKAFTLRMAERTWYPSFLRRCGVVLLIGAGFFTLKSALGLYEKFR